MKSKNKKISNELRALIQNKHLYSQDEYNSKLLILRSQLQDSIINKVDNESLKQNQLDKYKSMLGLDTD